MAFRRRSRRRSRSRSRGARRHDRYVKGVNNGRFSQVCGDRM